MHTKIKKGITFGKQVLITIVAGFLVGVLSVYAATTISNNISTGGTLDVTGLSTFSRATSTSATSTEYLYVGFDVTEPAGWNFAGGDLLVSGNAFFNSLATSSVALWIGSAGSPVFLDLSGGDLFVQDDFYAADRVIAGGTASSTALIVGGSATTTNLSIGERAAANATTTLTLGELVAESATCIKMRTTAGEWVYSYASSSSAMLAIGLKWTSTSCE